MFTTTKFINIYKYSLLLFKDKNLVHLFYNYVNINSMNKILYWLKAPSRWLRKLYNWTIHWSKTKKAPYALFGIAFAESSFFPIPPDVLLIPMIVSNLAKWAKFALICTLGSLTGALLGYFIGFTLFEIIGQPIVNFYGLQTQMAYAGEKFAQNAFLFVFTAAFTPIPFKVITIGAGLFKINLFMLIFASLIGRAGRFFIVAGALRIFGKKISDSIEKYFDLFSIIFILLLIGGFIIIKYLI